MPRLAKQRIDYLIAALKEFRDTTRAGRRHGDERAISPARRDADLVALAHYAASLLVRSGPQSQNAKVRVSMLSRGGAFGGVLGSSNAECAVNFVGTFWSVSNTLNTIASSRFICGK